jgi:hypothetical protein
VGEAKGQRELSTIQTALLRTDTLTSTRRRAESEEEYRTNVCGLTKEGCLRLPVEPR